MDELLKLLKNKETKIKKDLIDNNIKIHIPWSSDIWIFHTNYNIKKKYHDNFNLTFGAFLYCYY